MIHTKRIKWAFLVAIFVILSLVTLLPYRADAYVDPNTGGFFFSTVLPFVYGILGAIVIFWKRITLAVKNIFSKKEKK